MLLKGVGKDRLLVTVVVSMERPRHLSVCAVVSSHFEATELCLYRLRWDARSTRPSGVADFALATTASAKYAHYVKT